MRMAVVAKQIVHTGAVNVGRLGDAFVPCGRAAAVHLGRVQLQIACRSAEREIVDGHKVRTGKVTNHAVGQGDTEVADHREEPGEHWDGCPHQAEGEATVRVVYWRGHDGRGGGSSGRCGTGLVAAGYSSHNKWETADRRYTMFDEAQRA